MREVSDGVPTPLEIDLHGRAAELGVSGGAGVGIAEATQTGDIPGQFDDPLVIDIVQHAMESETFRAASGGIGLGGRRPRSYIGSELAEKQPGGLVGGGRAPLHPTSRLAVDRQTWLFSQ